MAWWRRPRPGPSMVIRCPVCNGGMAHGQAIFTAECSHTFHLRCLPSHSSLCPVCATPWRDAPSPPPPLTAYDDDDDLPLAESPSPSPTLGNGGVMVLNTHCEYPAISRDAARDGFAVLVHARAPSPSPSTSRAPIDLVAVLDVSGSMAGSDKLALVKRATGFVIDSLGAGDRLAVVAFSTDARLVLRLTRMTPDGKVAARRAVDSLSADGLTNIRAALDVAAKVLDGRRLSNPVSSVVLLSDGQDNQTMGGVTKARTYDALVPPSLAAGGGGATPVHAFGFGTDHDAAAMHAMSKMTRGTFSFVENLSVVQDTFARCVGGIMSVAAQAARIGVECVDPGVRVRAVKSGRYESRIDADGRAATVDVGELYAEEDRRFLVFLDVPRAAGDDGATRLIDVRCTYRDTATGQTVEVSCGEAAAVVSRPVDAAGVAASVEARRILDARRASLIASAASGDAMVRALVAEMEELGERVASEREYARYGRACVLSGMSSHAQQRASSVRLTGGNSAFGASAAAFATPAMRRMERMSEMARAPQQQQQQQVASPVTAEKNGGGRKVVVHGWMQNWRRLSLV
uniref:RING-type domain-containing protein n=1 Tax=Leersia perrieri TaxID=77586 RepID=A0A0D9WMZ2_9ORYZ